MKMKNFRSILAVATVAMSFAVSSLPAQASQVFTLDLDNVWENVLTSALQGLKDSPSSSTVAKNGTPQTQAPSNTRQKQSERPVQQLNSQGAVVH